MVPISMKNCRQINPIQYNARHFLNIFLYFNTSRRTSSLYTGSTSIRTNYVATTRADSFSTRKSSLHRLRALTFNNSSHLQVQSRSIILVLFKLDTQRDV